MNDETQHTLSCSRASHRFGFRDDETGRILSIIMQDMLIKDYHEIRIPLRQGSSTNIYSIGLTSSLLHSVVLARVYRERIQIQVLLIIDGRSKSEYKI